MHINPFKDPETAVGEVLNYRDNQQKKLRNTRLKFFFSALAFTLVAGILLGWGWAMLLMWMVDTGVIK